ncbi:hypothetical protein EZS27_012350 [termite gut metagenome]|uniref:Uncharacterized protein n=1 Tax=termite gut metagenome TaxID=433724 RepID=A0A5J4S219_9ZZZZ
MGTHDYKSVQVITVHDAIVPSEVDMEAIRAAAERHIKKRLGEGFHVEIDTGSGMEEIDLTRNETIITRHFDIDKIHKEEENRVEKQPAPTRKITVTAIYKGIIPQGANMEMIQKELNEHFPTTDFEVELGDEDNLVDFTFEALSFNDE